MSPKLVNEYKMSERVDKEREAFWDSLPKMFERENKALNMSSWATSLGCFGAVLGLENGSPKNGLRPVTVCIY